MKIFTSYYIFSLLFVLSGNLLAQTPPVYIPTSGLQAWYSFNGSGNDDSGNGNHATNFGGVFTSDRTGTTNSAVNFNGITQYMQVPAPGYTFSETGTFSISIWINKPNNDVGVFVMSGTTAGGNFICNIQGQSDVKFGTNMQQSAWAWATGTLTLNTWDHFVATYDNSAMSLYKNGVLEATATYPHSGAVTTTLPFYFARGAAGNYYEGNLDDVGIWNRVLTQSEIINLFYSCTQAFSVQPDSQSVNMNFNAQFIASSSDANSTYQWQEDSGSGFTNLINGGQYSGATSDTLNISNLMLSQDGNTYRCIISSGNCNDTSDVALLTVINNTGIDPIGNNSISVYPNPVNNLLIYTVDPSIAKAQYEILSEIGRVIETGKFNSYQGNINVSDLLPGVYFLRTKSQKNPVVKFLKQ